jgi:ech hydrogenase subunit D
MSMREEVIPVAPAALVGEAAKLKVQGYRFVTLSCTELDERTLDILYHFDKGLALKHLRLTTAKTDAVPSISPVYFAALLVENEVQDFFGLTFEGLIVDFKGTLYLEEEAIRTPYCRFSLRTAAPSADGGKTEEAAGGPGETPAGDGAPREAAPQSIGGPIAK